MARASFSGTISLGLVNITVKAYTMTAEAEEGSFHWLHRECLSPVSQTWTCKACGGIVQDPVKGCMYEGSWVVFTKEEVKQLSMESEEGNPIQVHMIVPYGSVRTDISDRWYYLLPYAEVSRAYYVLFEALNMEDAEAVVSLVTRGKSHLGVIYPRMGILALRRIQYFANTRTIQYYNLKVPPAPQIKPKEVQLARTLLKELRGEFKHDQFIDESEQRIFEAVTAKAAGKPIPTLSVPDKSPVILDLTAALEQSIKQIRSKEKKARRKAS